MVNLASVLRPDPEERKPSVLIAEDEPIIRLALSDYLQDCGFTVLSVGDAAEAMAVIEEKSFEIDVVLTDVRMPGDMNGFALARWIRQRWPQLPVLITTGDKIKTETVADLCGKNPIIEKPHDFKQVQARLRAAIDAAKA